MAKLEELYDAIRYYHQQGDTEKVARLGEYLETLRPPLQSQEVQPLEAPPAPKPPVERSFLRETADIPLKTISGAVSGIRFLTDVFGADNPISQSLRGVEKYIGELYSAQSQANSEKIAEIFKEAEDKGVLDQVLAGVEALKTAPADVLAQALGTAAPTILAGLAGAVLRLGAYGVRGAQIATGAAMGTGVVKSSIYDAVKEELGKTNMPPDQVEARAQLAQAYNGENLDMILTGSALGGLAASTGIDPLAARSIAGKILGREAVEVGTRQTARGVGQRALRAGVAEGVPEFAQGAQEQAAANIALQREGFDVPTMRGVVTSGTLEGLAGVGLGAGLGAITSDPVARVQKEREAQERQAAEQQRAQVAAAEQAAQQAAAAEQAQQAELQAREAALRIPLTQQDLLPLSSSIETVAEQRAAGQPQGDLFMGMPPATEAAPSDVAPTTEAAVTPDVTPEPTTVLDKERLNSIGFRTNSNAYKALLGVDVATPEGRTLFDQVIKANETKVNEANYDRLLAELSLKTPDATPNVRDLAVQQMQESDKKFKNPSQVKAYLTSVLSPDMLTSLEADNAKVYKELLDEYKQSQVEPQLRADRASVQVPSEQRGQPAPRVAKPKRGRLDDTGPVAGVDVRPEKREPDPLSVEDTAPQVAETQVEDEAEPRVIEELTTPIPVEAAPKAEAALSPQERIQQRIAEERRIAEEEKRIEKALNLEQAKAEQRGRTPTSEMTPGELEGLQAAREVEEQERLAAAKDTLGAFVRQRIAPSESIAPEDRVTGAQALNALADILYYMLQSGARSAAEAIKKAKDILGPNANAFRNADYEAAYAEAVKRAPIRPEPARQQPIESAAAATAVAPEVTGPSIFKELVSDRVADARLDLGAMLSKLAPKLMSMYQKKDQYGERLPSLIRYSDLNDRMTMTQQKLHRSGHDLLTTWGDLAFSNAAQNQKLMNVMLEATRKQIHPDVAFNADENSHLTADQKADYDALSEKYEALPAEFKDIYQKARDMLQRNFRLRRIMYRNMLNDMYADELKNAATPEEVDKIKARKKAAIAEHNTLINEIKGPYFPLMRNGDYIVIAESPEYSEVKKAIENATGDERKKLIGRLKQMEKMDEHYQVHASEKRSQQKRKADELKTKGFATTESKAEAYMQSMRANSFAAIDQLERLFDKEIDTEMDPSDLRKIRRAMIDTVIAGLPENTALKRQITRRNIAGASDNMLRAFAESMERDSFYLSRMAYMKPLSRALIDMRNESKGDNKLRDVYNVVRARMNMDMRNDSHPILSRISRISSIYHLGVAPSYLLTNMSQPFAITVPQLAGTYGAAKTSRAMMTAWADSIKIIQGGRDGKFFKLSSVDLSKVLSGGELEMAKEMEDLGKLDIANNMDTEVYTKGANPKTMKFWNMFNWASHNIEMVNRLSSALTAYRLEIENGGAQQDAIDAARNAIELTQLDYSDTNAAYFMKQGHMGGLNRLPMQFRKYQQGMIYLLARNFKNAWGGDPDAKKAFLYLMGTQLMLAGVRGVPVAAPLLFLMGMFGDDDDPRGDIETQLRNALADSFGPDVARVFWMGLPAMIGLDSGSLSMENLFSPFPMMRANAITDAATGKDAVTEFIFNAGGAPISLAARVGDGILLMNEGDYQKGLEKMLPKFLTSLIKAERLGTEGLTTRKGNVAVEADEFDKWDLMFRSLGFTPTIESEYYRAMMEKERVSQAIDKRRTRIVREIVDRQLEGKPITDLQEAVRQFNKEHPSRPITSDTIKRSAKQRVKDKAQRDPAGVKITKRDRELADISRFAR